MMPDRQSQRRMTFQGRPQHIPRRIPVAAVVEAVARYEERIKELEMQLAKLGSLSDKLRSRDQPSHAVMLTSRLSDAGKMLDRSSANLAQTLIHAVFVCRHPSNKPA